MDIWSKVSVKFFLKQGQDPKWTPVLFLVGSHMARPLDILLRAHREKESSDLETCSMVTFLHFITHHTQITLSRHVIFIHNNLR